MGIVEQLEELVKSAVDASSVLKTFPGTVRLVSHYDADGIASAAIMVKALEREGKGFRLSFVKQLSDDCIREMAGDEEMLTVFTDLGSGFLNEICEHLLVDRRKVIILDHHQVQGVVPEGKESSLYHVNPVLQGIDEDISGSGVSYLLARALSPVNKDLSEFAIIGAIGDSQTGSIGPHWGLLGINKEILKDAQSTGKISISKGLRLWGRYGRPIYKALQYSMDPYIPDVTGSESGSVQFLQEMGIMLKEPTGEWRTLASLDENETKKLATGIIKERIRNGEDNPEWIFGDVYELLDKKGGFRDANEFATMLNACGKSGNGFTGVAICLNDEGYEKDLKSAMSAYRREIGKSLDLVRKTPGMVRSTGTADYILAGDRISEHVISNVASIIEKSCLRPEGCLVPDGVCHKPVFAMADAEDGQVKVSGRISDSLVGEGISMKDILSKAAEEFGGQGGGHAGAAGATIPAGTEERFINTVEKLLTARSGAQVAASVDGKSQDVLVQETLPGSGSNNIKGNAQEIEKGEQPVDEPVQAVIADKDAQSDDKKESDLNGRKHEGTAAEGERKGREEAGQGREKGDDGKEGRRPVSKEMERQGLVRYLFS
ncbi:MAG: DHH family phosphoesterase [Candidatus Aenigmarchaeota archaeon]|nr:DHH family phosphoesterase [Candidatus Aenigmarchaeota archaeon]